MSYEYVGVSEKKLENLKNSVMFNLSLSSKELFHSNFLAYLFEKDNTLFTKILGIDDFKFDVKREHKKIDIEIVGEHKKYLIENKVKDIIKKEQLEKIEMSCKKSEYEQFILFSLLGNNLKMAGLEKPLWKEIGYEKIIEILKKHNFNDHYLESIKNDYCNFVTIMISLIKEQFSDCNKYILYSDNTAWQGFRNIRIHDLFMKYGMSHFVNYFMKKNNDKDITIEHNINRANATMAFYKKLNGIKYGIQTENLTYSRFIVGDGRSRDHFESIGWFDKNWRSKSGNEYLSYKDKGNDSFWYQIDENRNIQDIKYNELFEYIINDINIIK